jgi:hypothetical protein
LADKVNISDQEVIAFKTEERKYCRYGIKGHFARICREEETNKTGYNIKCNNYYKTDDIAKNCNKNSIKPYKICKRVDHTEKDCYFRKKRNNQTKGDNYKIALLTNIREMDD